MMWWWHGSGWGWFAMTVLMLAFWGFIIWAVVALARGERSAPTATADPETLLARRFAAGEIDEDEYQSRLDALRRSRDEHGERASRAPS